MEIKKADSIAVSLSIFFPDEPIWVRPLPLRDSCLVLDGPSGIRTQTPLGASGYRLTSFFSVKEQRLSADAPLWVVSGTLAPAHVDIKPHI